MARILSLVWYRVLPARFGGQKAIVQFNQSLGQKIPLTCLCSRNNEPVGTESFTVIPELPDGKWQFLHPFLHRKIAEKIRLHQITHLILEHCYHGLNGIRVARKHGIPLIIHSHNIEYLRFRHMHKWWWPILFWLEKKTHRAADLSMFKTDRDLHHAVEAFGLDTSKCMVVPHGLESTRVASPEERIKRRRELEERHGIAPGTRIIYFNGTLDYEPNALALREIVEKIIPALMARTREPFIVLVTGRIIYPHYQYLKAFSHPCYLYAETVDEVSIYFAGADIFINPVSTGGGIKVKLMEALSYGLPVVSYVSGATGIDLATTGDALTLVADNDTVGCASEVISHWNDQPQLASAFFREYHWEAIVRRLAERIEQL